MQSASVSCFYTAHKMHCALLLDIFLLLLLYLPYCSRIKNPTMYYDSQPCLHLSTPPNSTSWEGYRYILAYIPINMCIFCTDYISSQLGCQQSIYNLFTITEETACQMWSLKLAYHSGHLNPVRVDLFIVWWYKFRPVAGTFRLQILC